MKPIKNIKQIQSNERLQKSIDLLVSSFIVPVKMDKEEIWNNISNGIIQVKEVSVVPLWKKTLRVAAVLIPFAFLVFSVSYYYVGKKEFDISKYPL